MSLQEVGIRHKKLDDTLAATIRFNPKERKELQAAVDELRQHIPSEFVTGPAFCIFRFVSSVREGFDAEVGFPVAQAVQSGRIETRVIPAVEVLSLVHRGPAEPLGETYRKLYGGASAQGIISDEFAREVYADAGDLAGGETEVQFVIHDWNRLLGENLERVLGAQARRAVMEGSDALTLESPLEERFRWVKGAMERLDGLADEHERYDIVSSCAHVFPRDPIEKLRAAYEAARANCDDPLEAVDAVLQVMGAGPPWGQAPVREGRVITAVKEPRDPEGYEKATDEAARKSAYCYCPIVRDRLREGMPVTFCCCGAGWFRRQWEGAIGKPVSIEVVRSVLAGDDACEFAIHLPDDL
jgi:effector-binding domain-containing protein